MITGKILKMLMHIIEIDLEQTSNFFLDQENLLVMRNIIEKIAKKGGFTTEGIDLMFEILRLLAQLYQPLLREKYLETFILNVDIWQYSNPSLQVYIIGKFQELILNDTEKIYNRKNVIDLLLNCIERYTCCGNKYAKFVESLAKMAKDLIVSNMNENIISKLMGYLNILCLRDMPNYKAFVYTILHIFIEVYNTSMFNFVIFSERKARTRSLSIFQTNSR